MLLWAVALFVQSSIPSSDLPEWEFLTHDKLLHVLAYVIFAYTVHRGIIHQQHFPGLVRHAYLVTLLIIAVYGVSDEVHQSFVPGRQSSVWDWVADCVGAMVFVAVHWIWKQRKIASGASL